MQRNRPAERVQVTGASDADSLCEVILHLMLLFMLGFHQTWPFSWCCALPALLTFGRLIHCMWHFSTRGTMGIRSRLLYEDGDAGLACESFLACDLRERLVGPTTVGTISEVPPFENLKIDFMINLDKISFQG